MSTAEGLEFELRSSCFSLTVIVFGVTHDEITFPAAGPPLALNGLAGCAEKIGRARTNKEQR
jgi:hypothetical protein